MDIEGKLLVSRKNIVVSKDSIAIDKDLTKDRNLNTFKMYCYRRKSSPGSRTEKQEIVCMRVIVLLAISWALSATQEAVKATIAASKSRFVKFVCPGHDSSSNIQEYSPPG